MLFVAPVTIGEPSPKSQVKFCATSPVGKLVVTLSKLLMGMQPFGGATVPLMGNLVTFIA